MEFNHPNEYYEAYFGKESDYYLGVIEEIKKGKKRIFNLHAFLYFIFWAVYRKMWYTIAIVLLVSACYDIVESLILNQQIYSNDPIGPTYIFTTLIGGVITGTFSNYWYCKQANRNISKIVAQEPNEEERLSKIERSGGVILWPFILILSGILIFVLVNNL